jgi:hypothetical protein
MRGVAQNESATGGAAESAVKGRKVFFVACGKLSTHHCVRLVIKGAGRRRPPPASLTCGHQFDMWPSKNLTWMWPSNVTCGHSLPLPAVHGHCPCAFCSPPPASRKSRHALNVSAHLFKTGGCHHSKIGALYSGSLAMRQRGVRSLHAVFAVLHVPFPSVCAHRPLSKFCRFLPPLPTHRGT